MGYDFSYGYGSSINPADIAGQMSTIFLAVIGIYFLLMVYAIVAYVLRSLGTYTIAMRRGIKHPWLAWIPYGDLWILGSIADQYQYVALGQVKGNRKVLLGLQIAGSVLGLVVFGIYIQMFLELFARIGTNPYMMDMEAAAGNIVMLSMAMVLIGFAAWVLGVILIVFRYIALYNLYASCLPGCKVVFILLSILLGFTEPFLVFACRNKDRGMPPRKPKSVFETPVEAIPQPVVEAEAEPVVEPVVEAEPVIEAEPAVEAAEEPAVEE